MLERVPCEASHQAVYLEEDVYLLVQGRREGVFQVHKL
jgi:hypothetical protein